MSSYDLLYYCDSYPAIGMGHLKRGLDIIHQLLKTNNDINIAITGDFSSDAKKFLNSRKPDRVSTLEDIPSEGQINLAILDTIEPGDANTIPKNKGNKLANVAEQLFTFNTGIEQTFVPECIDGIFNQIPVTNYIGNTNFKKFFGPEFTPVNSNFESTEKRQWNQNLLIMLGGNKNQYGPSLLAEKLEKVLTADYKVNFILSPHFPENKKHKLKEQYPQFTFKQNVDSVVPYMEACQALICTYGNTTWEGLTMHKPVYIVSYLDFQKYFAEHLSQQNYAFDLGYLDNLEKTQMEKLKDIQLQKQLINKTEKKIQTPGIVNIAESILEEINVPN